MESIEIQLLAALRQQTNAIRELMQSVNSLRLEQIEQPVDYVREQAIATEREEYMEVISRMQTKG